MNIDNTVEKPDIKVSSDKPPEKPFRFLDRDKIMGRSTGRFNIIRIGENSSYVYLEDWFHTLTSLSTGKIIVFILLFYLISVLFWASIFYLFKEFGFVDISSFTAAMIISLETITTVGYSVTDINFGDYPIAFFLLYGEMMQAILMNSFCIGLIYTRLSRAISRSRSLLFTDKAIIRKIEGEWCLLFQVCELRRQQLLDSRIACYCVQKSMNKSSGVPFQMSRMNLSHPSDTSGSHLILMLPAVICHPIDKSSPLFPDSLYQRNQGENDYASIYSPRMSRCFLPSINARRTHTTLSDVDSSLFGSRQTEHDLNQSLLDSCDNMEQEVEKRQSPSISVADSDNKSYDTIDELEEINKYNKNDILEKSMMSEVDPELINHIILDYVRKNDLEIVVIIEGTESVTSNKLQARFSYAAADIVTNMTFAPCLREDGQGGALIDLEDFQKLLPFDENKIDQDVLFMHSKL